MKLSESSRSTNMLYSLTQHGFDKLTKVMRNLYTSDQPEFGNEIFDILSKMGRFPTKKFTKTKS